MKLKSKFVVLIISAVVLLVLYTLLSSGVSGNKTVTAHKKNKHSPETPVNPHLIALANEFDSAFQLLMQKHNQPGASVAIVYDSTIILLQGYGLKEVGTADSVNIYTVYRLASVSKPFASFLTGILVEDKILNWNQTVLQHWPGFRLKSSNYTKSVTLRHVLSHSTGLPYHTYTNMIEEALPFDTLISYLRDIKLVSEPGTLYSYQNVGYSLIGKVVSEATDKSYETQLKEQVFEPLGMNNASTDYQSFVSNSNIAQPHILNSGKMRPTQIRNTYYNVSPAGGVNASIQDMAQWLKALLGNREDVIKKSTIDSLFTPQVLANSRNRNFNQWQRVQKAYYGLGWRIINFSRDTMVYHGGYVTGYRSEVALLPSEKIAICVLTNAPGVVADTSLPLFFQIFDKHRAAINQWKPANSVTNPSITE
ncbi:MAG: class A beta-lactamase-related serine hydrolase [Cytophagia bacterium]|nr:class A beta-lactamase-related serine hydrolase [Cytophagia bacterium]